MNNVIIIDNDKYVVVMILFSLLIYFLFILVCFAIGGCGDRAAYYKDNYGNLYDIDKMRIY